MSIPNLNNMNLVTSDIATTNLPCKTMIVRNMWVSSEFWNYLSFVVNKECLHYYTNMEKYADDDITCI